MTHSTNRRSFLRGAAVASTGVAFAATGARPQTKDVAVARAASLSTAPAGGVDGAIVQSQTFDHVCLSANDLDLVADWYKRVFGFEETHRFELPDYVGVPATLAYLRLGNLQLESLATRMLRKTAPNR